MEIKVFYYQIFQAKIDIFYEANNIPIIASNNSSIHEFAEIKNFITDRVVSILIIASYSPCINPTEILLEK